MEIIRIYQGNVVSARELHQFLEVKSHYRDWITNRIKKYEFVEDKDFFKVAKILAGSQKGFDHMVTLTMAKELCMVENNDLGRHARLYFIRAEETLQKLQDNKRLEAFTKLEATKARLLKNIETIGGGEEDFIQIDYEGRKVFFNGRPLADENLHLVLLKGRDFATELANLIFTEEENVNLERVEQANKNSHDEVRQTIIKNAGKTPESFKSEGDIKKLQDGGGGGGEV